MIETRSFRQLDLNLLRVLCEVQRCGSVTLAAQRLSLSQPATSSALGRLRRHFGDALFVRVPNGLAPTALGSRVAGIAEQQLRLLETALSEQEHFNPAEARTHWRLSLSDLGEMVFLPRLVAWLETRAAHCQLSNGALPAALIEDALARGSIDLALGVLSPQHQAIESTVLFHNRHVALVGAHHPLRRATLKSLGQHALAVAAPAETFADSIEAILTQRGLADNIRLRARHFGAMPGLVAHSDLVAIVPADFVATLEYGDHLRALPLPADFPTEPVRLLWHKRSDHTPSITWLRAAIIELFERREGRARTKAVKAP